MLRTRLPDHRVPTTLQFRIADTFTDSLVKLTGEEPKSGRVAVKVINHLGDEVMKVFKV